MRFLALAGLTAMVILSTPRSGVAAERDKDTAELATNAPGAAEDSGGIRPLHLGIEGDFTRLSSPEGDMLGQLVLDVAYRPIPHLAIGLGVAPGSVTTAGGERTATAFIPSAEGYWFAREWLQLFARVSTPAQYRFGAGVAAGWSGAIAAGVGGRLWVFDDCRVPWRDVSISKKGAVGILCLIPGYEVRYQQNLDGYLYYGGVLPPGSAALTSDISLGLEF